MYEDTHTLKIEEFLRYAVAEACLNAWRNGETPTIKEIKEIILEYTATPITKDIVNRFIPERKPNTISKNIPGLTVRLGTTLSNSVLLPSDMGQVKAYVDEFEGMADQHIRERRVREPEFRKSEEEAKKGFSCLLGKMGKNFTEYRN